MPSAMPADHATRTRLAAWGETSLLVVAVALQWDLGASVGGDGYYRYQDLEALLLRGDLHPQSPEGAGYSLILPLLAAPLYLLGRPSGQPDVFVAYLNLLVYTALLPLAFVALRGPLGASTARRFLLLLLTGSMFTHHLSAFYAEVTATLFCGIGLWGVAQQRTWGWFLLAVGAVSTPALLLPLAVVCAAQAFADRRLKSFWPAGFAAGLYLAESRLRRGAFTSMHYLQDHALGSDRIGFSNPLLSGVANILTSFGKGLIFYVPGLFLPVPASSLAPALLRWRRLMLLFTAGMVPVYAKWWDWSGDWFWGPRFFLFASLPAALTLAVRLSRRSSPGALAVTVVATALSLWVGLDGALFGNAGLDFCHSGGEKLADLCRTTPRYSALWRPFLVSPRLGSREWLRIGFWGIVGASLVGPALLRQVRARTTLE